MTSQLQKKRMKPWKKSTKDLPHPQLIPLGKFKLKFKFILYSFLNLEIVENSISCRKFQFLT